MLLSSILSVLTGGATGLLGVIAQRAFDAWNKKQELDKLKAQWDHDAVMKDKDAAIMAQEWAARSKIAATEADAAKDVAQSNAFAVSLQAQAMRYSEGKQTGPFATGCLVLLDVVSGLVRPLLTVYLCMLTTYIWFQVRAVLHAETISPADALEIWKLVINTILYLTTTCILWWFGTRNKQSAPKIG
jgi:hypothetical protein